MNEKDNISKLDNSLKSLVEIIQDFKSKVEKILPKQREWLLHGIFPTFQKKVGDFIDYLKYQTKNDGLFSELVVMKFWNEEDYHGGLNTLPQEVYREIIDNIDISIENKGFGNGNSAGWEGLFRKYGLKYLENEGSGSRFRKKKS